MKHLLLKAATTATDEGIFEAVISTASIDRDGDIVEPVAIVKALAQWAALGKLMPLAYSHRDPATGQSVVIGHIDPASGRVEGQEVITKGWIDQSTERGAETWRLVKSGTLSFSYGYLVPDGGATKRAGKKTGYHITEIDLYEVSVVPVAPANNDTRVLSYKATAAVPLAPAPVRPGAARTEDPAGYLGTMLELAQAFIGAEQDPQDVVAMRKIASSLQALSDGEAVEDPEEEVVKSVDVEDKEPVRARSEHTLRKRHQEILLETQMAGIPRWKSPPVEEVDEPELPSKAELRRRAYDLTLRTLMEE